MKVAIRTDASAEIGSGHVIRCLTLADQLRGSGGDVIFLCATLPGALSDLVRSRGYVCAQLPPSVASSVTIDADETKAALTEIIPGILDWVVVDHYSLDFRWEQSVRACCRRLMVIDDIANRQHSCDLLLDQNYDDQSRYQGLVPADCRLLLGPGYALLRPEYVESRREDFRIRPLQRVFVFFGGSDRGDLTGITLKALSAPEFIDLEVDLVVGANYAHYDTLSKLSSDRGKTAIHGPRLHLADLMAKADLAIGAGGVTNWERMTVGLPSLVITLADNQVPISEQLHQRGVIRLLGKSEDITEKLVRDALLEEIPTGKYLKRIIPALAICDGQGAGRVLKAMQ